jgi:DNA mismatch endonuclease (patch repair protein)
VVDQSSKVKQTRRTPTKPSSIALSERPSKNPLVSSSEPTRAAPSAALSRKMSNLARTDTRPEIELRSALHARGLRYRVHMPVPGKPRRMIDIAFTRTKVAVLVDGCFWHSCPAHGMRPQTNREWWDWKLSRNRERDEDTNESLVAAGWTVVRVWEHDCPEPAADQVEAIVRDASSRNARQR